MRKGCLKTREASHFTVTNASLLHRHYLGQAASPLLETRKGVVPHRRFADLQQDMELYSSPRTK